MKKKLFSKMVLVFLLSGSIICTSSCSPGVDFKVGKKDGGIPKELSVFLNKHNTFGKDMTDYNDVLSFQMMEEATGCHVNWTSPHVDNISEEFNLMLALGQYTDAIVYKWDNDGCNGRSYAEDGVILPLSDMIDKCMPNFKRWCSENPEDVKKICDPNDGEIYYIPYIRADKKLNIFIGPQIRIDWLDKLGLEVPETADELYEVLKAFKTGDPNGNGIADEIPMSGVTSAQTMGFCALLWMFDTTNGFYVDGSEIKYGPITEEFKEGLSYIAGLYAEGLMDLDYILQDRAKMESKIIDDKVGFVYSFQPTKIADVTAKLNPSIRFEGIKHLKNKDGIRRCYLDNYAESILGTGIAISTSNPDPEGTLRWLDWIYSEEGNMAMNFGREGDTYVMIDGEPVFTDKILNNPDGLTPREAVIRYTAANATTDFPVLQDWRSYSQSISPAGIEAIENWAVDVDISGIMPSLSLDQKEGALVKNIKNQVDGYVYNMIDNVIMGRESIECWDSVVKTIKDMKIEEAIAIYQKAYNKYLG